MRSESSVERRGANVHWFLHRVYDELDGSLTDDISPIPRH